MDTEVDLLSKRRKEEILRPESIAECSLGRVRAAWDLSAQEIRKGEQKRKGAERGCVREHTGTCPLQVYGRRKSTYE